jgi:hypothetical protein
MSNAGNDGYYDGLVDSDGNLTAYGQLLVSQGKARRTGDGAILINGGLPQTGSANNPSGPDSSGAAAPGAPATGATGNPLTGGGGAPPTSTSGYNPGDVIIGNDGRMGIYARHYDPQTAAYTYGFLYFPQPGTPEFDANGGWATVEQQTGIQASFVDASYQTAKTNYAQSKAAATKLGNYTVAGVNADGSVRVEKGDGTFANITEADVAAGTYPGITASDFTQAKSQYQSAQANLTSGGQWHFAGVDPKTGQVTLQNNGTKEIKTLSAKDAMAMPGVNPLEIQQGIQQANSSNFQNASVGSVMGFNGYQPVPYLSADTAGATPGAAPPPASGAPPASTPPNPTPTPPPSPLPGAAPLPTPNPAYAPPAAGTPAPTPTPNPAYGAPAAAGTPGSTPGAHPGAYGYQAPPSSATLTTTGTVGTTSATGTKPYAADYAQAAAMYTGTPNPTPGAAAGPGATPTAGGTNALSYQQLQQGAEARNTYYNYAHAAQNLLGAQTAGRSRDTTGTGFGSISQYQKLAGQ